LVPVDGMIQQLAHHNSNDIIIFRPKCRKQGPTHQTRAALNMQLRTRKKKAIAFCHFSVNHIQRDWLLRSLGPGSHQPAPPGKLSPGISGRADRGVEKCRACTGACRLRSWDANYQSYTYTRSTHQASMGAIVQPINHVDSAR
jgi:hypothetical protein